MEPQETNQISNGAGKKFGIGVAVVALIALIGVIFANNKSSNTSTTTDSTSSTQATDTSTTSTSTSSATTTPAASATAAKSEYKDGTYTATGSYMSPGGADKLQVTLTLKNDVVTAASVKTEPGDNTSAYYQNIFAQNYTPLVVGKDISSIKLSKVSGSSLTAGGFNDALAQIEAQAKA